MSKVTSKLQLTVPKAVAERLHIRPGDEVDWVPAGDGVRIVPKTRRRSVEERRLRLRIFDEATERQERRQAGRPPEQEPKDRGWTREELYERARPR